MTDQTEKKPQLDPAIRDRKISRKARVTRRLETAARYGTEADVQAYRRAARDRDAYIDSFKDLP